MTAGGSPSATGGLRSILIATGLAGVGGYAITAVAAAGLGTDYALFALFWSALYLVIGTLSGVQQEVARATGSVVTRRGTTGLARFCGAVALTSTVVVAGSSPFWVPAVFSPAPVALTAALLFGTVNYVIVAAVSGVLYGVRAWRPLSVIIVLDVALRLGLIAIGLAAAAGVVAIAWLTVVPFPVLVGVAWLGARRSLRSATLDVPLRSAFSHVARTLLAAGATSVLVSGFPLMLGASSQGDSQAVLGAVVFALVITRAPLVVSTLALQSYLVVFFRDHVAERRRVMVLLITGITVAAGFLALLAWAVGVDAIIWVAGEDFRLDPGYIALLVLSSVPTAWVAVSGALVLAGSFHNAYAAGWFVAALGAVALLAIPGDLFQRSLVALSCGPLLGFAIHLIALRTPGPQRAPQPIA